MSPQIRRQAYHFITHIHTQEIHMKKIIALAALTTALTFNANAVTAVACDSCGTVTDTKTIKVKGEGSGLGIAAGAVLGGVLGHQIGNGRGKDLATVAGAGAGAYAGHQVEKNAKSSTKYQVIVKLDSGENRTFTFGSETAYKVGDKIKVVDGKLTRL
jgi:outer membrane lipoprotein SlyB